MEREKIFLSNLDLKIINFLKEEHNITEIVDKFNLSFSQCKRHIKRIERFLTKRTYGTFKFLIINNKGVEVSNLFK